MPNYVDNLDVIDAQGRVVNVQLQDRETLALATTNRNSIVALNDKIDNVDAALSEAIHNAVTDLSNEIENTSDALSNEIANNIVYVPASSLNIDNTGTSDCSSILSTVTDNVGLKAGTYLIDSNCTINAQVVMAKGAKFNVTSGHTLTINGQILAGRYTIFEGNGNIVVNEVLQDFGYPEWFNDDIIKCYKTFRHIILAYKTYTLTENLEINRANSCIEGVSYPTDWNVNCSKLVFTNDSRLIIGRYDTDVINDFPRNITIQNMYISSTYAGDVVSVYGCVRAILKGLYIYTETGITGICFYKAIGSLCRDIYVQSMGITGTFYGYRFYDASSTGQVGKRSASVWLENCTYSDTNSQNGNTYGFYIGAHHSDIYMQNCEVAEAANGLTFDSLSDSYSIDFLILNCDFDSCRNNCIQVFNCTSGSITIDNCYGALRADSDGSIVNTSGSTCRMCMSNLQLQMTNAAQIGINVPNQLRALMNGIDIAGVGTPVNIVDATYIMCQYLNNGVPTVIPTNP